jgi:hypothetical protein
MARWTSIYAVQSTLVAGLYTGLGWFCPDTPPLVLGEVATIKTALAAATQSHNACGRLSADTSLPISRMLAVRPVDAPSAQKPDQHRARQTTDSGWP